MLTESYRQQARVFAEILGIFRKRNALRQDLWEEHGALEAVRNIKAKADRASRLIEHLEKRPDLVRAGGPTYEAYLLEIEDDLKDLANYSVFAVRCLRKGRLGRSETPNTENQEARRGQ